MISPSWMSTIEISTLVELVTVTLAAAECTTVHMAVHIALHMTCALFQSSLLKRVLLEHFFCNLIGYYM